MTFERLPATVISRREVDVSPHRCEELKGRYKYYPLTTADEARRLNALVTAEAVLAGQVVGKGVRAAVVLFLFLARFRGWHSQAARQASVRGEDNEENCGELE